jgi:hypothetical protein
LYYIDIVSPEEFPPETSIEDAEIPAGAEVIDQAVAVLDTAEQIGLILTPAEVAVHYGLAEPTRRQRMSEALKRIIPENAQADRLLTTSAKIGRIAVAVSEIDPDQPTATDRFNRDKQFWDRMNVENAWGARVFDREHFSRTGLDLVTGHGNPPELDWLKAADSQTVASLQTLQENGRELRLRELTKTPSAVLDSTNRIAEDTQKTFVHTWLPRFLENGQKPILTEEELAQHNYDEELDVIAAFRERALGIEADGELDEEEQAVIDQANQLLSDGLAGEYVLQRLLHDHAASESESLRSMLPMLIGLSAAAWGVQEFAPNDLIRAFAKVAGSGDDIAAEVMSLPRLKLSKEKLRHRLQWFIPLAAGMVAADALVDKVDTAIDPHIGGAMYGVTTVGLSAASTIGSLKEHSSRYQELVAEGKVPDEHLSTPGQAAREHYIYNDPLRKGIVAGVIAGPVAGAALWPWIADKPYFYVPLGAIEPIAAFASTKFEEKRLPHRLKKYTRGQTAQLEAGD